MSCHVYPCFLGHIIEKHMDMISELVQSAPLRLCFPQCVPTASDFWCQSLQHLSPLLPPESGQETEDPLELPTHDDVFRYVGSLLIHAAALPPVQSTERHEHLWKTCVVFTLGPSTMLIPQCWATEIARS